MVDYEAIFGALTYVLARTQQRKRTDQGYRVTRYDSLSESAINEMSK